MPDEPQMLIVAPDTLAFIEDLFPKATGQSLYGIPVYVSRFMEPGTWKLLPKSGMMRVEPVETEGS